MVCCIILPISSLWLDESLQSLNIEGHIIFPYPLNAFSNIPLSFVSPKTKRFRKKTCRRLLMLLPCALFQKLSTSVLSLPWFLPSHFGSLEAMGIAEQEEDVFNYQKSLLVVMSYSQQF